MPAEFDPSSPLMWAVTVLGGVVVAGFAGLVLRLALTRPDPDRVRDLYETFECSADRGDEDLQ